MSSYIEVPIETDPEILAQDAFDYLDAVIPDWVPNDANLETIMIEAMARMTAEARDVASAVPTDIFRYFGELVGITPQEATLATSTTNWTMIDNKGYTILAGTQVGIELTGDVTVPFEVTEDTVVPLGFTTASGVPIQAIEAGSDASGITGLVTPIDTLDYVSSITLVGPTSGGIDAEDDDDYLNRLRLRLQLLAPRPILARDFAIFAQDVLGVDRAVALDGHNPLHNLLTANQSSLETDTTGWTAGTNTTIARDVAQAAVGSASLRLRSTAAGDVEASTTPNTTGVTPGQRLTALTSVRTSITRTVRIYLEWYTAADAFISQISADVSGPSGAWTVNSITGTAPATATKARITVKVIGTAAGAEDHWFDKLSLYRGSGLDWVIGGTVTSENNERMVAVAIVDAVGEPVSSAIRAQVDTYLEDSREVTFVVNVIDADYATVDVTFTAKSVPGWEPIDVENRAEAALTAYLSPVNWGLPVSATGDVLFSPQWINQITVRYLELTQALNLVSGLDYVTSLTFRKGVDAYAQTDVVLPGSVPLPRPGIMSGTVTA